MTSKTDKLPKQILLLDDVNLMCQFLNETLRTLPNVECHTASRVASAMGTLSRQDISLAIIDLNLPDGSGLEVVKAIRKGQGKGAHDIPILIFSGNTYKQAVKECMLFKVSDIIAKPIVAMDLRKRVEMHLNKVRNIEGSEYFERIDEKLLSERPDTALKAAVVNDKNEKPVEKPKPIVAAEEVVNNPFIKWPKNATTGYHQLDRRIKDLCYLLNHFHFYRTTKETYPTAKQDLQEIRLSIDDLKYALKPLKAPKPKEAFWKAIEERIKLIEELPFERFCAPKIGEEHKAKFSKMLRTAWLAILTKPIIQLKK